VQQQFQEGVALSSQVLDAELALRAARSRHARALADQAIAGAALLQVEGEVW
jgi:outer membrane protein TolC